MVLGVQDFDGDVDVFFVGIEEGETGDAHRGSYFFRGVIDLGEAVVGGGEAGGWVEALGALGEGGAYLGGTCRTAIGGLNREPGTEAG